ncbi:MAG: hypothetical protein U0234_00360 [Sandaracinus sp.]
MAKSLRLEDVVRIIDEHVVRTRGGVRVTADTQLFLEGLVDSFAVAELVGELERARGAAFAEGSLVPDDFESPRTLFARLEELS